MTEFKKGDLVVMIDSDVSNNIQEVTEQDVGAYYMKFWRLATQKEIDQGYKDE